MSEFEKQTVGALATSMYLGIEVATRLVDVLVAKQVLSKGEARATLYSIAEGIRKDADADVGARSAVEAVAVSLEKSGDNYIEDTRGNS